MDLENKRICIDGVNLQDPAGTGIKTYALTLLKTLESLGVETSILLSKWIKDEASIELNESKDVGPKGYYRAFPKFLLRQALKAKTIKKSVSHKQSLPQSTSYFNYPRIYDLSNAYFNDFRKPTKLKFEDSIDALHLTTPFALDVVGARKVTTIHDLIPFTHPKTCVVRKPERLLQKFQYAAESSDLILTVSEHSKRDIIEILDVDPSKVSVTYQTSPFEGVQVDTKSQEYQSTLTKHGLMESNYFLFIGGIEPKKNVSRLIQAYTKLGCGKEFPLVIVGKKAWLYEEVLKTAKESASRDSIYFLDYVAFGELPHLLKGAASFVFPSIYEGFGLPVLEALNFDCPVITSNVSSLPEVCGDAGILIDPYNVDQIAEAMDELMKNSSLRETLAGRAQKQVAKFSTEAYSMRLKKAYKHI